MFGMSHELGTCTSGEGKSSSPSSMNCLATLALSCILLVWRMVDVNLEVDGRSQPQ